MNSIRKPRYEDVFEVDIERLDERGHGHGRVELDSGVYHVLVRHALPGERVRVQVLRRRKQKIEAIELETVVPSPHRVAARCVYFGTCGGCSLQDLAYAEQLHEKHRLVERALRTAGCAVEVEAVIACDDPWRYRNKMDFTFGTRRWVERGEPANVAQDFALGLHPRGQFRKVLDIDGCSIQFERGDAILCTARRLALERGLSAWDLVRHEGLLRHLVLRTSHASGEILAQLTTSLEAPELIGPYVADLMAAHPEITTFVQSINTRGATIAQGERELVLHGEGSIRERLAGLWFRISASSFFQTNTPQAEKLVAVMLAEAACTSEMRVLDLYCGAGSLSLPLAGRAGHVHGVELVEAAVLDARRNAEANGINNTTFSSGDVLAWMQDADQLRADVIVVDPPRAGLHPKVVELLARSTARRIVYVSCNVNTAAPELARLGFSGWNVLRARPLDLFPHTPHVECVFTLERRP